jgi:hypothetical protein
MSHTRRLTGVGFLLCIALGAVPAPAATLLFYTSSPDSWVGGGETVLVNPSSGFEFFPSRNFHNGVSFGVNDFNTNPDFWTQHWWYLDFAAPNNAPLTPGTYVGATRFPFQEPGVPGLNFTAHWRGNNALTGHFTVLEARYSAAGDVLSFAADFIQYDEGFSNWWNVGSIRFNSDAPVSTIPEPGVGLLVLTGLALLKTHVTRARRNRAP